VVAIDRPSRRPEAIFDVLNRWKDRGDLTIWNDDTWMKIGSEEEWPGNDPHPQKGSTTQGTPQRRQRTCAYSWMRHLHQKDQDWTLITDTNEFLVFNYPHAESEYITLHDTAIRGHWKKHTDKERESVHGLQGALSPLYDPTTTAKVESDYNSNTSG
jgi:hypothetical protein